MMTQVPGTENFRAILLESDREMLRDVERCWEMLIGIYWLLQVRHEGQPTCGFADPSQDRNHSPLPAKSR